MSRKVIQYEPLYERLRGMDLESWIPDLQRQVETNLFNSSNGHLETWLGALESLPVFECLSYDLVNKLSFEGRLDHAEVAGLLKKLHPWRKGPIQLSDLVIDTEWRSDWKWNRLKDHMAPMSGRTVLDIGCGNGYYLYRMLGAGAKLAIGIDPFLLFVMQFWAINHFSPPDLNAWVLPLGWEDLPPELPFFDTVFSMGVLYHRRNAQEFLSQLKNYVRPGGELVLETLVIEGGRGDILVPEGRYAKMRNVHYIPSVSELESELSRAGWSDIRCIDLTPTSTEEQRSTDWMTFESLKDYLDPKDSSKTVEGYPSPIRAIFLATRKI